MALLVKKGQRKMKKMLFADEENRVRKATLNDTTNPPESLLTAIAADSFDMVRYEKMYLMLMKRLRDEQYPNHVYKALRLVEYLLKRGDERLIADIKRDYRAIVDLQRYHHRDDNGMDVGEEVRIKATMITSIIENNDSLNDLRNTKDRDYSHDYNFDKNTRTPRQSKTRKKASSSRVDLGFDFENDENTPQGSPFDATFSDDDEDAIFDDKPSYNPSVRKKREDRTRSPTKPKKKSRKKEARRKKKPSSSVERNGSPPPPRRSKRNGNKSKTAAKTDVVDFVLGGYSTSDNSSHKQSIEHDHINNPHQEFHSEDLAEFAEPPLHILPPQSGSEDSFHKQDHPIIGAAFEDVFPDDPPDFDDSMIAPKPKPHPKPKFKPKPKDTTKAKPKEKVAKAKGPVAGGENKRTPRKKRGKKTEEKEQQQQQKQKHQQQQQQQQQQEVSEEDHFGIDTVVVNDPGEVDLLTGDDLLHPEDWTKTGAVLELDEDLSESDTESDEDDYDDGSESTEYETDSKSDTERKDQTLFDDELFSSAKERDLLNLDDINAVPKHMVVKKQKRKTGPSLGKLVEQNINQKKYDLENHVYEKRQPRNQRSLAELPVDHHQKNRRRIRKKKKPVKLDAYGFPIEEEKPKPKKQSLPAPATDTSFEHAIIWDQTIL